MSASHVLNVALVAACPYPVPQGSQVYFTNTARALETQGIAARLVVYGYGVGEAATGLTVHPAWAGLPGARKTAAGPSLAKPFLDLSLARTLRQVVRDHQIDVVGAHNYEGLIVALSAGVRPIVYHAHNAMADELPHYFRRSRLAESFGRWLDRTFPKRADHVVVPHGRLAEYLVACGCSQERVSVVPPPHEAEGIEAPAGRNGSPAVLYAGNLDAYQNLPHLYRVMDRVREGLPDAELHIATASRSQNGRNGFPPYVRVTHTPDMDSLRGALAQDAVFVCPRVSWSGYPIKLLNAMAAGMAIVCTESAAHPLTDQRTALVVPDGDVEAFAGAVTRALTDPSLRAALGARAREALVAHHSPEIVGRRLAEIYRGLETERTNRLCR